VTTRLLLGSTEIALGGVTHVMGVINLSPESANTDTVVAGPDEALEMAGRYRRWGASLIDVGGQSSHYRNPTIAIDVEISRVVPTVERLAAEGLLVSVDTWKPEVAEAALEAGAVMINDTGGLSDPLMRRVIAAHQAVAVLVYVEGPHPHRLEKIDTTPGKVGRTVKAVSARLNDLVAEGIERLVIDPGIALNYRGDYQAYTRLQLEITRNTELFRQLGRPLLLPVPRKREAHRVAAFITLALEHQADFIRVHDVEPACDLVELFGRRADKTKAKP
jgi:dihydropteroate synthase